MHRSLRLHARAARIEIQAGRLRGPALAERLLAIPFVDRDTWIDEVLGVELPPPDIPDLPRGAVPYLPCGVDEIVAMVRELPLRVGDVLVDLGSGLGRVVMLGHLLSGARALGVEIQAPLVDRARQCASELSLAVSFVHANAAELDVDASVFFLYAPCNGAMLARVVDRLAAVARRRPIAVCAVGIEFPDVPWLAPRSTSSRALTIYESASACP